MAACTWPSNSNLSQTLKKEKYLKVTQLLSRLSVPTTFHGGIVSKLLTQAWNKAKISPHIPLKKALSEREKSLYKWRILIGRISWRTPPGVDPRLFERVFLVHNFSSSSLYRGDERVKQILAVIALNQLETKVNNLQMCIIRCRFEQVLWRSPFTHANFCNFVLLRHLCLFSKFASKLVL